MHTKGLAAFFICLAMATACEKKEAPPPHERPLTVGWFLWTGWYPMAIAQEMKLFAKHGVDVNPILYQSYTQILPDLSSGKLDAGFSGMYETLKANIPDIRIVLVTDHSDGAEGLVTIPEIKTPQDLKGKRIGVQGALSGSEFLITTYLRKQGLSSGDVTMLSISPEVVLDRMPSQIQAGYTWDPFLSQARKRGYRLLFTTADMPGLIVDIVAFHGLVTRDRPQDVRKFIAAWFEASDYWRTNPLEAENMIAKVTGLKRSEITREGCRFFSLQDNVKTFQQGDDFGSIYFTARKQVEFFIGVGDASSAPDIQQILSPQFLR